MRLRLGIPSLALLVCILSVPSNAGESASDIDNNERTVRSQISEGLNISAVAKAAITEFFQDHGRFPIGNAEAGLVEPFAINGKFVVSITVTAINGIIQIDFGGDAAPEIYGRSIEWKPTVSGSRLEWSCSSEYISRRFWPEAC